MKRFCSLTKVIVSLIVIITLYACEKNSKLDFSIGLIADCQYCKVEGEGIRKYSKSNGKLKQCVAHFNTLDLEYTIHLGDFIDRDWRSFDSVIVPKSNKILHLLNTLIRSGYILHYESFLEGAASVKVYLKYHNSLPAIQNIQRVSVPSKRVYLSKKKLKQHSKTQG